MDSYQGLDKMHIKNPISTSSSIITVHNMKYNTLNIVGIITIVKSFNIFIEFPQLYLERSTYDNNKVLTNII